MTLPGFSPTPELELIFFRQLWQNSADPFWLCEVSGDDFVFIALNPAEAKLDPRFVPGLTMRGIVGHGPEADALMSGYFRCRDSGQAVSFEQRPVLHGQPQLFHTLLVPVLDADGRVTHIWGTSHRLTDLLITQLALEKARQAAEAANIAKSAFLSNMSHEMRTPLHQIIGLASLIRRQPLSARQADQMDKLEDACQRLTGIVDTVLELTRLEAQRFELSEGPVKLDEVIGHAVASVLARADEKGLALQVLPAPEATNLRGDAAHIELALSQYLTNAVRFTEAGSVTIRCSLAEEQPDSVLVRFEVSDTGPGIAPEDQARLFNLFEQVDNSSTRQHGGLGAGLAMTRKLARLMGGDAGCSSCIGEGSTFWFTARLAKPQQ